MSTTCVPCHAYIYVNHHSEPFFPFALQERLEREYNLYLITTAPTVIYQCVTSDGETRLINSPGDLPEVSVCWFDLICDTLYVL